MPAYYNEIDPFAAEWLRQLIKAGAIAHGEVDTRSIEDVTPNELAGFTQCHFFAGIGGWSYALRLAGWPDDKPVWTGSCPCQPFSQAGKGEGFADERHLWPSFHWLIRQCQPNIIFGEQVASKDTDQWFDLVQADLEALGYAFGLVPFPAASVEAPHERDRAYWVADASSEQFNRTRIRGKRWRAEHPNSSAIGELADTKHSVRRKVDEYREDGRNRQDCGREETHSEFGTSSEVLRLANPYNNGCDQGGKCISTPGDDGFIGDGAIGKLGNTEGYGREPRGTEPSGQECTAGTSEPCWLAENNHKGLEERFGIPSVETKIMPIERYGDGEQWPRPINNFWRDADWIFCRDGKWRPVEPSFKQMVDGLSCAMAYLRCENNKEEKLEVMNGATTNPYAKEVLREMREGISAENLWFKVGGKIGIYEATILLSFLLEQEGKLGRFVDCATQGGSKACEGMLRDMRENQKSSGTPQRREYTQQHLEQLTDALSKLPQDYSLEVIRSLNGSPLAARIPNRVGMLRGYGNAIVAPQAQAFIEAFLEVTGERNILFKLKLQEA